MKFVRANLEIPPALQIACAGLLGLSAGTIPSLLTAQPDPAPPARGAEARLSEENRERLRQVLAQAWQDEEVISAREAVHTATERYREALQEAVARIDPGSVDLMSKLHQGSRSQAMRHKFPDGGAFPGRPLPSDPAAAVEFLAKHEAEMRGLDRDERNRFVELALRVHASGVLDQALEDLRHPKERPEMRGLGGRKHLRDKLFAEMKKTDPWSAAVLERPVKRTGRRPPSAPEGKGNTRQRPAPSQGEPQGP